MKLRYLFFPTIMVAAITGTCATLVSRPEEEAVQAARARQNLAIANYRIEEVASFWTDDVTICRGLGIQLAGKAEYRKLLESDAPSPKQIVYQRQPSSVEVSPHWPLAFETGVWSGHLGGVKGPTVISGRYSAQWVKRGGKWLIRAEVYVALDGADSGLTFKAAP